MRTAHTNRRRIVLLAAVAALLLLSTADPVSRTASAQPGGGYAVRGGILAGGGYRLTCLRLPAADTMSGDGYHLLSLARPEGSGSGCCCTYLPCILRND